MLAARAEQAGVEVRLDVFPEMLHGFQMMAGRAPMDCGNGVADDWWFDPASGALAIVLRRSTIRQARFRGVCF